MARKLANLSGGSTRSSRRRIGGDAAAPRAGAGGGARGAGGDPLIDTLKAWVEERGPTRPGSPPPLPSSTGARAIQIEPLPDRPNAGSAAYPAPPGPDAARTRSTPFAASMLDVTELELLPVDDEAAPMDVPVGETRVPRMASGSGPLTTEANTPHSTASEDAIDLRSALDQALAAAREGPAGPSLALSSSLTRPASLVYSACLLLAGLDPAAASRAFRQVADRSRFFGLSLANPAQLTPVRLASAVADLRRASPDLSESLDSDFERLDGLLLGSRVRPEARVAVEHLRALLRPDADA